MAVDACHILHVDMDAFFASVEQRDNPALKNWPVVVGGTPQSRGVVAAASYEARRYGIRSAMPAVEAGRRCPHAAFLRPRMAHYKAVSNAIMQIFLQVTPLVEKISIDEAFLDVAPILWKWGKDPVRIGQFLKSEIQQNLGLTASVGIAPNKFIAKFASDRDKPDGLTVMPPEPDKIAAMLAKLSVSELWGVGPKTAQKLQQYGIHKVADIQALDAQALQRYLGNKAGAHIYEVAFGRDDRKIVTHRDARSISNEHTFVKDVTDYAILREQVIVSIEDAARELRRLNRYAKTVFIKVRYSDFSTFTRQASLTVPSRNDRTLLCTALTLLDNAGITRPVRLIGAGVAVLTIEVEKVQPELPLFSEAAQKKEQTEQNARLDAVVDELRNRYGEKILRRGFARQKVLDIREES